MASTLILLLVLGGLAGCSSPFVGRFSTGLVPSAWQWAQPETGLPRQVLVPAVAIDPGDGSLYAGLYHSSSLASAPAGSETLGRQQVPFAGTPVFHLGFTPGGQLLAATGLGLYRQEEDGWLMVGPGQMPAGRVVFAAAATATDLYAATDGQGLQRRQRRGGWTTVLTQTVLSLALVRPAEELSNATASTMLYAGTAGAGIFTSPDGGHSWLPPAFPDAFVPEIVAKPGQPTLAIASLRQQLVLTDDGGRTWHILPLSWASQEVVSLLWTADNRLYAGTGQGNLYLSIDQGAHWELTAKNIARQGGVLSLAERDGLVLAGTWTGIYASQDGGQTWHNLGPDLGDVQAFSLLATSQALYLGTQAGLFDWDERAARWQIMGMDFPGGVSALAKTEQGWLLAGTAQGVFRSPDQGQTWQPAPDPHISIRQLLPVGGCTFAVANFERIYRSCDDGERWQARWGGLGVRTEVKTLMSDRHRSSGSPLLLAGTDRGLFHSRSDGLDWRPGAHSLSDQTVLALLPLADETWLAGGTRGLFRSQDGGQTFEATTLTEVTVTGLLADPSDPALILAATAFAGLYYSADGGRRWQPFGPGELDETTIQAMTWFDGALWLATPGGIWQGK